MGGKVFYWVVTLNTNTTIIFYIPPPISFTLGTRSRLRRKGMSVCMNIPINPRRTYHMSRQLPAGLWLARWKLRWYGFWGSTPSARTVQQWGLTYATSSNENFALFHFRPTCDSSRWSLQARLLVSCKDRKYIHFLSSPLSVVGDKRAQCVGASQRSGWRLMVEVGWLSALRMLTSKISGLTMKDVHIRSSAAPRCWSLPASVLRVVGMSNPDKPGEAVVRWLRPYDERTWYFNKMRRVLPAR